MADGCWVWGLIPGLGIGFFPISWGWELFFLWPPFTLNCIVLVVCAICLHQCIWGVVMILDCEATLCPAFSYLGVAEGSLSFGCSVAMVASPGGVVALYLNFRHQWPSAKITLLRWWFLQRKAASDNDCFSPQLLFSWQRWQRLLLVQVVAFLHRRRRLLIFMCWMVTMVVRQ